MKKWCLLLALALGCGACRTPGTSTPATPPERAILEALIGHWAGPMWGGRFEAYYAGPHETGSLSYSTLTQEGRIVFHEFEVFRLEGSQLTLQPHPMGQPEVVFTYQPDTSAPGRWVFENPENDFPTRITYDRTQVGRLTIELSDPVRDSDQVEVFALERVTQTPTHSSVQP